MLHTFYIGAFAFLALCLSMPLEARAYIDPATTTYVIQIVSAVVITLGITIGVFFSRIRMFLLNIRVKTAEWGIKLFSKKQTASAPPRMPYIPGMQWVPASKRASIWQDSRPFLQRLLTALSMSLAIAFTFAIFGPYEMYALNLGSFAFRINEIFGTLVVICALSVLVLTLFLSLLRGKVFDVSVSLLFGLLLASYAQANFLRNSLGQLTGDFIAWNLYKTDFVLNLFAWVLLLSIPLILYRYNKKVWAFLTRFVPLLLVVVQVISMVSLQGTVSKYQPETEQYLSTGGLYEVSAKENIIVIILDRLDNRFLDSVSEDSPGYFDRLDGFTYFTNNATLYSATFPSVANLLTGNVFMYEGSHSAFLSEAYKSSTFLPLLRDHGYQVKLYTEPRFAYANASDLEGIADNMAMAKLTVNHPAAIREFLLLSAYRYAPVTFKPFFWTSTDQFSKVINKDIDPPPYTTDDLYFYDTLRSKQLSIDSNEKSFTFIHLNGPHAPFNMDENAQPLPSNQATVLSQTKGSFHIVFEYLDQLKALGLYQDATIIITGDHGARPNDISPLQAAITTGLFVKPSGQAGTPLAMNSAPVSSDNFRPTIYQAAGLPYEELGQSYFDVPVDSKAPRYQYFLVVESQDSPRRLQIFEIMDNARDFNNWKLIDEPLLPPYQQ